MPIESTSWQRHDWRGTAGDFHSLDPPSERGVWLCQVDTPALILGSSQSPDVVSLSRATERGIDVVKRRSGGGVVFVHPDDSVWIDVIIPRDDPFWVDDVTQSMVWLGEKFVEVLSPWLRTTVYEGAFDAGSFGKDVCFASTSPGEVFADGSKVVGISQRRTRAGSRFQCVIYRHWNPAQWADCLATDAAHSAAMSLRVETVAASADDIMSSLMSCLRH